MLPFISPRHTVVNFNCSGPILQNFLLITILVWPDYTIKVPPNFPNVGQKVATVGFTL